jgi:hypothetical protein
LSSIGKRGSITGEELDYAVSGIDMSQHFELMLACDLRDDTPENVLQAIRYMTSNSKVPFEDRPSHPFDKHTTEGFEDWRSLLAEPEGDLPGWVGSYFQLAKRYDEPFERYTFGCRLLVHDDVLFGLGFIDFIPWLAQYSKTQGFVGYWREELDERPLALVFKDGLAYSESLTGELEHWPLLKFEEAPAQERPTIHDPKGLLNKTEKQNFPH